ncbi:MAG: hypothetical protein BWY16_00220 [Candidatus Omnitrophica bacterium ADurb.Bin205]|nr:MAG: hypothetical protein BWY16_00220 [Candidatus Omnitrophica bacterium ADurb.Bin205]
MVILKEMMEEIRTLEAQYLIQELRQRRMQAMRIGLEDQGILQPSLAQ